MSAAGPVRVLVVDDSAIVRKLLSDSLRGEQDIEVVGTAADPFIARDMILRLKPDVLTLDVEMPRLDGISFLRRLMQHWPLPVIVVSSLTQSGSAASVEALRAGAFDVIPKPGGPHSVGQVAARLKERIRAARGARTSPLLQPTEELPAPASFTTRARNGLIAIGASTGGPQAIEALLTRMPEHTPPIVIVQHMPAGFTRAFAERVDKLSRLRVVEAGDGDTLEGGHAYIAPGDRHLLIEASGVKLRTRLNNGPVVHHQRPAVDVLFRSLTELKSVPIVAVLLTGMGQDGADGLLRLKQAGAITLAQDEHSCVIFGMPREAIERGAACKVVSLLQMPASIAEAFDQLRGGTATASLMRA